MSSLLRSVPDQFSSRIVFSFALFLLSFILPACSGNGPTAQELLVDNLAEAKAKWENLNPHDYSFEFKWRCRCSNLIQDWVAITVENDTIVQVADAGTGESFGEQDQKQFMTIDALYDFVERGKEARDVIAIFSDMYGIPVNVAIDYEEGAWDEIGFETRKLMFN